MTVPNAITVLRILLVPPFVIYLLRGEYGGALAIFAVAAISDFVDGYVARRFRQRTSIGAFIDPLADKLLAGTAFVLLAYRQIIPDWLAVLVISREVVIVGGLYLLSLLGADIKIAPSRTGKMNTAVQLTTVCLCLLAHVEALPVPDALHRGLAPLFLLTGATTIVSGFQYLRRGLRMVP
ncbi:MAG: CDP-diacylglycerol--glycerol-3-phosphate 3-phosphatidyltransferase [Myxococcota bacterium]